MASMTTKLCPGAVAALVLLCSLYSPSPCLAFNQGRVGINLGATSFFDGFGRADAGFVYQTYLQYGWARQINDAAGHKIDVFENAQIDALTWLHQANYFFPGTLFGGRAQAGLNLIVPVVGFRTHFNQVGPVLTDNEVGFGDVTFGPFLQFAPVMVHGIPLFTQRFGLDWFAPVGRYNPDKNINQGANYTSFNPSWAATLLPARHVEVSWRAHWIYNFVNDRPTNAPRGLAVDNARAGQAVWLNFASSYEVLTGLHVGVNGYYFKQLTDDRFELPDGSYTNGQAQGEGRAKMVGIGPGALFKFRDHDLLFANFYFQLGVVSRPPTDQVSLRYLHIF